MVRSSGGAMTFELAEVIANIMSAAAHCSCLIMYPPKDGMVVLLTNNSAFGAADVVFRDVCRTLRGRVCRQTRCAAHQRCAADRGCPLPRYSLANFCTAWLGAGA